MIDENFSIQNINGEWLDVFRRVCLKGASRLK